MRINYAANVTAQHRADTGPPTLKRVAMIVDQVTYNPQRDWWFTLGFMDEGAYAQIVMNELHCETGELEAQSGRKFYISPHMTDSEIVQTLFLAIRIAEEHELREWFKFRGEAIFGPHFDAAKLAEFASQPDIHDVRPNPQ